VLRGTTSRGLCGLICPSRTSERGGEGYCVNGEGEKKVCVFITAEGDFEGAPLCVCFITAGPITKLCAWGEEESGGHVL
jgi:hypothetical protein